MALYTDLHIQNGGAWWKVKHVDIDGENDVRRCWSCLHCTFHHAPYNCFFANQDLRCACVFCLSAVLSFFQLNFFNFQLEDGFSMFPNMFHISDGDWAKSCLEEKILKKNTNTISVLLTNIINKQLYFIKKHSSL